MSSGEGNPMNRLADESSPYLRLHKENPVDWYPWGPEALERARREDRPIFLSVGYSTCYWCHVMERESFSDPGIAGLMNEAFVNIKLDREERPELDEIYMTATQVLTGQGGWPNSVFLTPELKPFFAGTYFPPADRPGLPGFPTVVSSLRQAWSERRADVEEQAESVAGAIRHYLEDRAPSGRGIPGAEVAEQALVALERSFDPRWGGFGGAPKFPTPSNLFLLMRLAGERPRAAEMLTTTLDKMTQGGIYDHVGGGFHRYATDAAWRIPHFEKMLYDNGLLLELLALDFARTGDPERKRTARETADFLARELTSPEGAFWSALDAETDGREGAFYVWTGEELRQALGAEDADFLAPVLGFDGPPFFEEHYYVLHLPKPLELQAERRRIDRRELLEQIAPLRQRLFSARAERPPMLTDDKVLADWNGMAIRGLAEGGRLLSEPSMVEQAVRAARFVLAEMRPQGGPLIHSWRQSAGRVPAFLADYAFMVRGLLALDRAAPDDGGWLAAAVELTEEQLDRLAAPEGGFFVAADSDELLARSQEVFDGAVPAANAVAVDNLLDLAERTGEDRWLEQAEQGLERFSGLLETHASAARSLTGAVLAYRSRFAERTTPTAEGTARQAAGPVAASLELEPATADGWRSFELRLEIEPGWHLYAPDSSEPVTEVEISGNELELDSVEYPAASEVAGGEGLTPLKVFTGEVRVHGRLRPAADQGRLVLRFQACDERRCLAPQSLSWSVPESA